MAPAIIRRFSTVIEAQVAASALESGGLHPQVWDLNYGALLWTRQLTVPGGFRLVVPYAEAVDALAYLESLPAVRPRRPIRRPSHIGWRWLALILTLSLGADGGWLAVRGLRRNRRGWFGEIVMGVSLALLIAGLALVAVVFVWWLIPPLLLAAWMKHREKLTSADE